MSNSLVQKLVKQQKLEENIEAKKRGQPQFSYLTNARETVTKLVEENSDATLVELCELFANNTENWVSRSAMGRFLNKLGFSRKKKTTLAKPLLKKSKNYGYSIGSRSNTLIQTI